ncbi:hypothetical protein E2C01_049580 [Portunus trituberculatus]|uniref:Uncharacterized protein n=1 Tax=Portunus trituberculatus TaxID=210409 RepID=A0A5B7GE91_PORTR|nr:hypothetical protein [Portunus trituberculatus]
MRSLCSYLRYRVWGDCCSRDGVRATCWFVGSPWGCVVECGGIVEAVQLWEEESVRMCGRKSRRECKPVFSTE